MPVVKLWYVPLANVLLDFPQPHLFRDAVEVKVER